MQSRAIFEAVAKVAATGAAPIPEIMVPLAATAREIEICRQIIETEADAVQTETGQRF